MSETMLQPSVNTPEPAVPAKPAENPERWKTMIIALTMINTILVAIIAGLQTDANIRANNANRDSQYYAVLTSGELQRIGLQNNYDMTTYARILDNTSRSLVMGYTALQLTEGGDEQGATFSNVQALVAQAQADTASKFSIFYQELALCAKKP